MSLPGRRSAAGGFLNMALHARSTQGEKLNQAIVHNLYICQDQKVIFLVKCCMMIDLNPFLSSKSAHTCQNQNLTHVKIRNIGVKLDLNTKPVQASLLSGSSLIGF